MWKPAFIVGLATAGVLTGNIPLVLSAICLALVLLLEPPIDRQDGDREKNC